MHPGCHAQRPAAEDCRVVALGIFHMQTGTRPETGVVESIPSLMRKILRSVKKKGQPFASSLGCSLSCMLGMSLVSHQPAKNAISLSGRSEPYGSHSGYRRGFQYHDESWSELGPELRTL
jgi:surfactin synthase thioesterase subunit